MTKEQAKHEITSVLSQAGNSVSFWIDYAEIDEIDSLLSAVTVIKRVKEKALSRQQQKLG